MMDPRHFLLCLIAMAEIYAASAVEMRMVDVSGIPVNAMRKRTPGSGANRALRSAEITGNDPNPHALARRQFSLRKKTVATSQVRLWVVNFAQRDKLLIRLRGTYNHLRLGGMVFGEVRRQLGVQLAANDVFIAKDRATGKKVRKIISKGFYGRPGQTALPEFGDCVVTTTEVGTKSGSEVAIYPFLHPTSAYAANPKKFNSHELPELRLPEGSLGSVTIFNTLELPRRIDVIFFDQEQCESDKPCLFRVGNNLARFVGLTVRLQPGNYEVKVVPHNEITDVLKFKNKPSIIREASKRIFLRVLANEPSYLILGGKVNSPLYPPSLRIIPDASQGAPFDYPTIPFLLFNAYPSKNPVTFSMPLYEMSADIPYGKLRERAVAAALNDQYKVAIKSGIGSDRLTSAIPDFVPYKNGNCLFIADSGQGSDYRRQIDAFFTCWHNDDQRVGKNMAWIFSYHALAYYPGAVDVLIAKSGDLHHDGLFLRPRIYIISRGLKRGVGQPAAIDPGYYVVKIVPKDMINTIREYRMFESLVPKVCIHVKANGTYFAIAHGLNNNPFMPASFSVYSRYGMLANVGWGHCENVHRVATPTTQPPVTGKTTFRRLLQPPVTVDVKTKSWPLPQTPVTVKTNSRPLLQPPVTVKITSRPLPQRKMLVTLPSSSTSRTCSQLGMVLGTIILFSMAFIY